MSPSALDETVPMDVDEKTYPPAKIFPVREVKFEKAVPADVHGRQKAAEHPGSAAIVIDNGKPKCRPRFLSLVD
jgi:actin-related protein 5